MVIDPVLLAGPRLPRGRRYRKLKVRPRPFQRTPDDRALAAAGRARDHETLPFEISPSRHPHLRSPPSLSLSLSLPPASGPKRHLFDVLDQLADPFQDPLDLDDGATDLDVAGLRPDRVG